MAAVGQRGHIPAPREQAGDNVTTETSPVVQQQFISRLDQLSMSDVPVAGGKNASLGEMLQQALGRKAGFSPGGA